MVRKTVNNIIKIAKKEVWYIEKESNKYLNSKKKNIGYNNYTKYNELFNVNGCYWCCYFICWLFCKFCDGNKEEAKKMLCGVLSGACDVLLEAFQNSNKFDSIPKEGDLVFFSGSRHSGSNHIALVYLVKNDMIYTIEGNTSNSEGLIDNGGCVATKSYPISYNKILGYGHPKYDLELSTSGSDNY